MSKSSVKFFVGFLAAVLAIVALVTVDVGALAQNTNSSTTMADDNANANTGRRGGRRGRRGARRNMAAHTDASGEMTDNQNASGNQQETSVMAPPSVSSGQDETTAGVETDLTGNYTGTVSYSEHDMNGEASLNISGESYTLTVGSMTHSGFFRARTTRGYTTAALELGPAEGGQMATILSLRVCKRGDNLSLKSVGGERRKFSFRTRGSARGGRGDCCRCGRSDS